MLAHGRAATDGGHSRHSNCIKVAAVLSCWWKQMQLSKTLGIHDRDYQEVDVRHAPAQWAELIPKESKAVLPNLVRMLILCTLFCN